MIYNFIIGFVIGCAIACLVYFIIKKPDTPAKGKFIIDYADPEKDVYTLQLDTDLAELATKEYLVLKIETKSQDFQLP